ncbi:hypothetical protein ACFP3U_23900 [Kitasatospora misakiensis]|uniref:Uncharacterized protein n=1 Tax=Kitasatospora misakiensis TaxID=67330 RepID=A0ABW0X9P2_9ACTN
MADRVSVVALGIAAVARLAWCAWQLRGTFLADRPQDVGEPHQVVSQRPILIGEQILQVLPGFGELPDGQAARLLDNVVELVGRDRPEVVVVQGDGSARRGGFDVTEQQAIAENTAAMAQIRTALQTQVNAAAAALNG